MIFNASITQIGGGTGLEYETGIFTPTADISRPTISFAETHSRLPSYIIMIDENESFTGSAALMFSMVNWYEIYGHGVPYGASYQLRYGVVSYAYTNNGKGGNGSYHLATSSDSSSNTATSHTRYYATESGFRPYGSSNFIAGSSYTWAAYWISASS